MNLLRRSRAEFLVLQMVCDLLAVICGLLAGFWFRFYGDVIPLGGGWSSSYYVAQLPWAVLIWIVALHFTGNYVNHPRVITFNRARRLFVGSVLAIMMLVTFNYFARNIELARVLYPVMLIVVTTSLIVFRLLLQSLIVRFFVGKSLPRSRVLIVGLGPTAFRLAARILKHPEYAYELVGFVSRDSDRKGRRLAGVPILGGFDDLRDVLRDNGIQDVFIAQAELERESFFSMFLEPEMLDIRVHVVPNLAEMMRSKIYYDEFVGVPLYRVLETPMAGVNAWLKRAFDVVVAGFGLIVLGPVLAVIAALVKVTSPGPAFFRQERLGLDGEPFHIWKFRTMPVDAERHGPVFGTRDDPRATPLGAFLRRWNIDELPQLWNVLRGDMSLVGPRPERAVYVERFREMVPLYMTRHKVRTGITGWAQVHGLRGGTSISQRLRYDLYYIENWSLWLDIKILLMTFFVSRRARRRIARRKSSPEWASVSSMSKPADHPERG